MPPIGHLEKIVQEAMSNFGPDVQDRALSFLHDWVNSPDHMRNEVCKKLQRAISKHNPKKERGALRAAHRTARENFASELAEVVSREAQDRQSASAMKKELLTGYELVRRQGKGFVFFGTARSDPGDTEYERAQELARETSILFGSTIWSGAGPGDMDAVVRGGQEAGGRIGGSKIILTEDQSEFEQNVSAVFSEDEVTECEYFAPRKVVLTEAAMRERESDRTGVICLPGGWGSMDELFEFGNLKLLKKLGTGHPVPLVLMNYNGEYDGIVAFIERAISDGRIGADQGCIKPNDPEQKGTIRMCKSNAEALDYLADYYNIPENQREYAARLRNWDVEPDKIADGTGSHSKKQT